jgi:predicted RNA binding protein YcfA (HicA-like mRNA interferase family)
MLSAKDCAEIRSATGGKATGYRYADVARWLQRAGWSEHGSKSSHRTWRSPKGSRQPVVDGGGGEILPVYVKRAARAILQDGGCNDPS